MQGNLYTREGAHAGSIEIELERATIAFGRRVRVLPFRLPSDGRFQARWFLDVDRGFASGALVAGGRHSGFATPAAREVPDSSRSLRLR